MREVAGDGGLWEHDDLGAVGGGFAHEGGQLVAIARDVAQSGRALYRGDLYGVGTVLPLGRDQQDDRCRQCGCCDSRVKPDAHALGLAACAAWGIGEALASDSTLAFSSRKRLSDVASVEKEGLRIARLGGANIAAICVERGPEMIDLSLGLGTLTTHNH